MHPVTLDTGRFAVDSKLRLWVLGHCQKTTTPPTIRRSTRRGIRRTRPMCTKVLRLALRSTSDSRRLELHEACSLKPCRYQCLEQRPKPIETAVTGQQHAASTITCPWWKPPRRRIDLPTSWSSTGGGQTILSPDGRTDGQSSNKKSSAEIGAKRLDVFLAGLAYSSKYAFLFGPLQFISIANSTERS